MEGVQQNFELQLAANQSSSTTDQNFSVITSEVAVSTSEFCKSPAFQLRLTDFYLQDSNDGGNQRAISQQGLQLMTVLSHADMGLLYTPSVLPLVVCITVFLCDFSHYILLIYLYVYELIFVYVGRDTSTCH